METLYRLTYRHGEKAVRKAGAKLMRNVLRALTTTYPAEWRPFDRRYYSQLTGSNGNTLHRAMFNYEPPVAAQSLDGRRWDAQLDDEAVTDPNIDWHIPSTEELAAAQRLVAQYLRAPLDALTAFGSGQELPPLSAEERGSDTSGSTAGSGKSGKSDGPLERALQQAINLTRGLQTVLGPLDGEEVVGSASDASNDSTSDYSRCPLVKLPAEAPLTNLSVPELTGSPDVSLRTHLLRTAQLLAVRLESLSGASIKSRTLLLKLLHFVLFGYGVDQNKLDSERYQGQFSRSAMHESWSGRACTMRPFLVQKAYDCHLMALQAAARRNLRYTRDVECVLRSVQLLAINDFAEIRTDAQFELEMALARFPLAIDAQLHAALAVFRADNSSDEQVTGALGLLSSGSMLHWTTRKWSRLAPAITALVQCGDRYKDDKVQVLIHSYFTKLFADCRPIATRIQLLTETSEPGTAATELTAAQIAQRNAKLQNVNAAQLATYRGLIAKLLEFAQKPASELHWRYQPQRHGVPAHSCSPSATCEQRRHDCVPFV